MRWTGWSFGMPLIPNDQPPRMGKVSRFDCVSFGRWSVTCRVARQGSEAMPPSLQTESHRRRSDELNKATLTKPRWSFGAPLIPNDQPPRMGEISRFDCVSFAGWIGVMSCCEVAEQSDAAEPKDRKPPAAKRGCRLLTEPRWSFGAPLISLCNFSQTFHFT